MLGPIDLDVLPASILKLLERPKPTPAPATSIAVANVPATEKIKRATAYLARVPGAVSGSGGHSQTWSAALAMCVGFDLSDDEAYALLSSEYNPRCDPPWSEKELWHKIKTAQKGARRPRGFLLEKKQATRQQPIPSSSAEPSDWKERLRYSAAENPKLMKSAANVQIILEHDPKWKGVLAYNRFSDQLIVRRDPPFARNEESPIWRDVDDTLVQSWLEREYDVTVAIDAIARAVSAAANTAAFHPVREYLGGLKWDGTKRVDEWLTRVYGCEVNDYTRSVGAMWMLSAVARANDPGCQAEAVLILEGPQGWGKSKSLRILCKQREWFTDEIPEMGTKAAAEQIQGAWIIELGELDALSRGELSAVKAYITRRDDKYRAAFGRRAIVRPRQCVFAGTVNPGGEGYLRDETGNRRFWPIVVRMAPDIQWLTNNVDQLWAETMHRFKAGEQWYVRDAALLRLIEAEQAARVSRDSWVDTIEHWVIGRDETSVREVLLKVFDLPEAKHDRGQQMRAARALVLCGFERKKIWCNGTFQWGYARKQQLPLL